MKKAAVIFLILFALSLAVPVAACIDTGTDSSTRELVTLFNDSESNA